MMASREEEEGVGGYDMRDWIEGVWSGCGRTCWTSSRRKEEGDERNHQTSEGVDVDLPSFGGRMSS
jgi:hypothetical protein